MGKRSDGWLSEIIFKEWEWVWKYKNNFLAPKYLNWILGLSTQWRDSDIYPSIENSSNKPKLRDSKQPEHFIWKIFTWHFELVAFSKLRFDWAAQRKHSFPISCNIFGDLSGSDASFIRTSTETMEVCIFIRCDSVCCSKKSTKQNVVLMRKELNNELLVTNYWWKTFVWVWNVLSCRSCSHLSSVSSGDFQVPHR